MTNPYTEAVDWAWGQCSVSVTLDPKRGLVVGVSDDTNFTQAPAVPPAVARRLANYLIDAASRVEATTAGGWKGAVTDNTFDDGLLECKYIYDCTKPNCDCGNDRSDPNCNY